MISNIAIIISPNWRDYAEKYLADCLESLRKQNFKGFFKIFIMDNESTPETVEYIKKIAPEIELGINKNNDGFCKGNNDALKRAMAEGFEYFVLLNMDTVVEPDWLEKLVAVAEERSDWGGVQSRVMLWPAKDKINSLGNNLHYLGLGFSAGGGKKWDDYKTKKINSITYFSGVAVLLNKKVLDEVGLFDEEFWMYHDDLDLSWRIRLAGYQIYLAPESVVYHKYQFTKSIKQYYWMERNRFVFLLTCYKRNTLLLILPMLILLEVGILFFSFVNGFWKEKFKVYSWLINPVNWRYIKKRRVKIKHLRRVNDKDLAPYLSSRIEFQEVDNFFLKYLANPLMSLYWAVVRRIILW